MFDVHSGWGLIPCADEDGTALKEVRLTPDGSVRSVRGDFLVDQESGRLVQETFKTHGTDIPIDYEHQTLGGMYASPSGQAPAAGWIKNIWHEAGRGIIAAVEWTAEAVELIRSKKYRYLSPVAVIRRKDRKLVGIHSAGLTNKPAIPGMEALAAKQGNPGMEAKVMAEEPTGVDPGRYLARIAEALGIDETGDDAAMFTAILEEVRKLKGKSEGGEEGGEEAVASKAILEALGAKEDASESELVVMINTLKRGSELTTAEKERLDKLEETVKQQAYEKALQPHLDAGRVNPNDKELLAACREVFFEKGPERFELLVGSRQPDPPPGKTTAPPGGAGSSGKKNREQIIAHAAKEYEEEKKHISTLETWVNGALKEEGKMPLTDKEKTELLAA